MIVGICASGPSLTRPECTLLRQHVDTLIAVNLSYQLCDPDIVYVGDYAFLSKYRHDMPDVPIWTCSRRAARTWKYNLIEQLGSHNSGQMAIKLAEKLGAEKIILLGYDVGSRDGNAHWHGQHVEGLRNPATPEFIKWRKQFNDLSVKAEVINCSRFTTLECFPRIPLEEAVHSSGVGIISEGFQSP